MQAFLVLLYGTIFHKRCIDHFGLFSQVYILSEYPWNICNDRI